MVVFSKLMVEEGEKKAAEAARRKAEAEAQRAAAGLGPELVVVEEEGLAAAAAGAQQQHPPRDGSLPNQKQPDAQRNGSQERQVGAAVSSAPQELAAVLAAVDAGQEFAPASGWLGRIKGRVFKLGPSGLGYYLDKQPVVEATLAQVGGRGRRGWGPEHCSAAVLPWYGSAQPLVLAHHAPLPSCPCSCTLWRQRWVARCRSTSGGCPRLLGQRRSSLRR